jgi:hypothetical protein
MEISSNFQGLFAFFVTKSGATIKGNVKTVDQEKKVVTLEQEKETERVVVNLSFGNANCKTVTVDFDSIEIAGDNS